MQFDIVTIFPRMVEAGLGEGILARAIQRESENVLIVDHGSLYPALQRLENRAFIAAEWGTSDNNRKARFYAITPSGRRQLTREQQGWQQMTAIMERVMRLAPEE